MSKIHLELLDKKRQEVFNKLSFFKKEGYLAGGTALALQINHRKSVDFDVFVSKAINGKLKLKIERIFGKFEPYVNTGDQISFRTRDNIGVTFVWYYYKTLYPLVNTSSISLASAYDIVSDKAHTIGRRAVWRDYVDFFFLLKARIVTLQDIIRIAEKKFSKEFNQVLFLQQVVYFKDLEIVPIEFIKDKYSSSEIKSFLDKKVRMYLKKTLKI